MITFAVSIEETDEESRRSARRSAIRPVNAAASTKPTR
jgi:hypothetical protein